MNRRDSVSGRDRRRVAVFASYSSDGFLPLQVLPYLEGLRSLTSAIIFVCDNDLAPGEAEKLEPFVRHVISGRHGEYDFGSYKRGAMWAFENGLLEAADDLILCNDSCFGPIDSFAPMIETMEARKLDFWGATESHEFSYHLQSYFVSLSHKVFTSEAFHSFIKGVTKQPNVQKVIMEYELGLTKRLQEAGFSVAAFAKNLLTTPHPNDRTYRNVTAFPLHTIEQGLPLVKVKALRIPHTNLDGPNRVLSWLKKNAPDIYRIATSDLEIKRFEDATDIGFSLILPTHNRAWCISKAISAVLAQTHQNFELIIVDDGSTDNTENLVSQEFAKHLEDGRIRYIRLPENVGVCNARNIGVACAKKSWIAYIDSDNEVRSYFLTLFANAIVEHRGKETFYAQLIYRLKGHVVGKPFDRDGILKGNFIDLGTFVHKKSLFSRFGGFDVELKRLVDWDLCIRYTRHTDPIFLSSIVLDYNDADNVDRISTRESYLKAEINIFSKHSAIPTVSTLIVSYNHQQYITEAIESALAQKGACNHEILISDDGSDDGTSRIIERYAKKYPNKIRNISREANVGISENYRRGFGEAAGNFIAVLEGDDFWIDPEKNWRQVDFLIRHPDASMVFSRIELLDMKNGRRRLLDRQNGLRPLLSGEDFARDENLNLIANFSSAMFRKNAVSSMPSAVYEPRLNEITLSFYLDRLGKLGFIDGVMGVYRLNATSVWTGASQHLRLQQAIAIRENALRIARGQYKPMIRQRLEQKKHELRALLASA